MSAENSSIDNSLTKYVWTREEQDKYYARKRVYVLSSTDELKTAKEVYLKEFKDVDMEDMSIDMECVICSMGSSNKDPKMIDFKSHEAMFDHYTSKVMEKESIGWGVTVTIWGPSDKLWFVFHGS